MQSLFFSWACLQKLEERVERENPETHHPRLEFQGMLRGFSRAVERQVLAWSMASSLDVGGDREKALYWRDRAEILDL